MVQLDFFALNLALPQMARDLDVSVTDLQWVISGYMLALAASGTSESQAIEGILLVVAISSAALGFALDLLDRRSRSRISAPVH